MPLALARLNVGLEIGLRHAAAISIVGAERRRGSDDLSVLPEPSEELRRHLDDAHEHGTGGPGCRALEAARIVAERAMPGLAAFEAHGRRSTAPLTSAGRAPHEHSRNFRLGPSVQVVTSTKRCTCTGLGVGASAGFALPHQAHTRRPESGPPQVAQLRAPVSLIGSALHSNRTAHRARRSRQRWRCCIRRRRSRSARARRSLCDARSATARFRS